MHHSDSEYTIYYLFQDGNTALLAAARWEQLEVVEYLILAKADINATNNVNIFAMYYILMLLNNLDILCFYFAFNLEGWSHCTYSCG